MQPAPSSRARRIEDYALLSDCRSAALASRSGSIDWWCAPRFDSAACFASLLGTEEHGRFLISPKDGQARVHRRYRGETMVLETLIELEGSEVALIDFLLFSEDDRLPCQLVRIVEGRRGSASMHMELLLRFDYGSRAPWLTRDGRRLTAMAGPDVVRLYSDVPTESDGTKTWSYFEVRPGERLSFCLTMNASHLPEEPVVPAEQALERTESCWLSWSARSSYKGVYRECVQRSLLTLKALTYRPTGGVVAAPSCSLPEQLGGERNWDYRYCWIRDATITLYALLVTGYEQEAQAWRTWLLRAVAGEPNEVQVIYGIAGERRISEQEIGWLPGYESSRPVRIGNAAYRQLQLDTFGELMDVIFQCLEVGLSSEHSWELERRLLEHLESAWTRPDESIWEVRGPRRHFTYSKVMAWVAFDRAVRIVERFGREGPIERWRRLRAEIHEEVCRRGFSTKRGTFVQSYGSEELDASLLLLPLVGFLPPSDPRIVATVTAIERELLVQDTFVRRYRTHPELDGLPAGEGAFLACSFWLVSNRVMQGRVVEARELFDRLLALRNDVGLLSEQYDPAARRMLGNFPQAFSHLALVEAAMSVSDLRDDPATHRTQPARSAQLRR